MLHEKKLPQYNINTGPDIPFNIACLIYKVSFIKSMADIESNEILQFSSFEKEEAGLFNNKTIR